MSRFANLIRGFGGDKREQEGGAVEAVWNAVVVASSDATLVVEGNHYFPPDSVNWDLLSESDRETVCPWKGRAGYYSIDVDGERNQDAAWSYATPRSAAAHLKDHVAFSRGVEVRPSTQSQS